MTGNAPVVPRLTAAAIAPPGGCLCLIDCGEKCYRTAARDAQKISANRLFANILLAYFEAPLLHSFLVR